VRKGVALLAVSLALAASLAGAPDARAQVPVLRLEGRGFGHGVGLSQWGAKYAADAGATAEQIVATFYPGTTLATAGGPVRVAVHQAPGGEAIVNLPNGGEVRSPREGPQAPGFPVAVAPGGSVALRFDAGGYRAEAAVQARDESAAQCLPVLGPCPTPTTQPGSGSDGGGGDTGGGDGGGDCGVLGCGPAPTSPPTSEGPSPTTTAPPPDTVPPGDTAPPPPPGPATSSEPLWVVPAGGGVTDVPARGRAYRGLLQAVGGDGLRLVNEVDVETYLKGMGEVPATWPAAAQQAQAIAARTWVLRAMAASGEVCDFDRCQVYVGATREAPGQSAAVDATRGMVLTYGGALAASVYSADAGGVSATTFEGFGTPDGTYPYLTTVRYDTPDPLPWALDVALSDVGGRFGYRGSVTGVRVTQTGPSGRALEVTLDGSAGPMAVPGRRFASGLGLRSTLFSATVADASAAPAPPPPATDLTEQALPDDAAAIAEAVAAPAPATRATATRAERAAPPADLDDVAADLAGRPAVLAAVGALGLVTAVAMAWGGLVPAGGPARLADRVARPALPDRRPIRRRSGQRGRAAAGGTGSTG